MSTQYKITASANVTKISKLEQKPREIQDGNKLDDRGRMGKKANLTRAGFVAPQTATLRYQDVKLISASESASRFHLLSHCDALGLVW